MYRTVDCQTWQDPWFEELPPMAKLVFLNLITNTRQTACGVFEVTLSALAFETGLDKAAVVDAFNTIAPKVEWWPEYQAVWVRNFYRHQRSNSNELYERSARKALLAFHPLIQASVCDAYPELYTMPDTSELPIPIPLLSHRNATPIPLGNTTVTVTVTEEETETETEEETVNPPNPPEGEPERADNRSLFYAEVREAYPADKDGHKPAPKAVQTALKSWPLRDAEVMVRAAGNYARSKNVAAGFVMGIGRFVRDGEYQKYLEAPSAKSIPRVNGAPIDTSKYAAVGKYARSPDMTPDELAALNAKVRGSPAPRRGS